ncbi:MAG TPA: hypothetical protein VIE67_13240 [Rudaea sp.]|jgi:hypothetical protein|uniref:T4 family baseplate hub assembly chaperone n=1 Tax=Rudaea sp. TaxID=2136325 RepID=UPI002F92F05D
MRALGAAQLLGIWEQGLELSSPRRALVLLAAACPETDWGELAALPVGRRDDLLLQLREHLFGAELTLVAACPACSEQLESTLRLADLRVDAPGLPGAHMLSIGARDIVFHAPTAGDLIDLPQDPAQASMALLARCVDDLPATAGIALWSADDMETIGAAMAAADPQARTDIGLVCAACNHRWESVFDIASFLWCEIEAWAQRTLHEIHALARAYAWREQDILALSPTRRQLYLELSQP